MKDIILLGSTGSIGRNTVRVVEAFPSRFRIVGLAVRRDVSGLMEQAARLGVKHVAVADETATADCTERAPDGVCVYGGEGSTEDLVRDVEADLVVCAVVGMAGLRPVMAAAELGRDIALATKEVLVAAGEPVLDTCRRHGARILPVDSEHSAVFQCLAAGGKGGDPVRRVILTASGGPFGAQPDIDLAHVSLEQVLDHPRWDMGQKVTVDSATLMNKGLEIVEAHWLFDMPVQQIDVVIHPESIVHSMVEFADGSLVAQLSLPDMRFAIQYALAYPERLAGGLPVLDLAEMGSLHFREPDTERFPALALARAAAERGGTLPTVLNAANEVAVSLFLEGRIAFPGIWELVEKVLDRHDPMDHPGIETILETDAWARRAAEEQAQK